MPGGKGHDMEQLMHEHMTGSGGFMRMNLGRNVGELKGQCHENFRGSFSLSNSNNVNR
jgi:hypothetical protein